MRRSRRYPGVSHSAPTVPIMTPIANNIQEDRSFPWESSAFTAETVNGLPSYFKSVTKKIPNSPEIEEEAKMPLALMLQPGNVNRVPKFDFSNSEIPRCQKCESYISCFCTTSPTRRTWRCGNCGAETKFPENVNPEFIQEILRLHVYDMKAPETYILKYNVANSFCFIIDTSFEAVASGFTRAFCESIKSNLQFIKEKTYITIIACGEVATIFDIHRMKESVIIEPGDFRPTPQYVSYLDEDLTNINKILDILANRPAHGPGNCFGSALVVASFALRLIGGVVIASCCCCPSIGPFSVKSRATSDPDSEVRLLRLPTEGTGYKFRDMALVMNRRAISLNLFSYTREHSEIACSGLACGLTDGRCFHYETFDPEQLQADIFNTMSEHYKWNCSMKLRCSDGIELDKTYGNVINHNDTIEFPVLSKNSTLAVTFRVTEPIKKAVFQAAILWSDAPTERYVRVFSFSLPITQNPMDLMEEIDESALSALFIKSAAISILNFGGKRTAKDVQERVKGMIKSGINVHSFYHILHALEQSQMISNCSPLRADQRMSEILNFRIMTPEECILMVYPKLVNIETGEVLPLNVESINEGVFALADARNIIVWASGPDKEAVLSNIRNDDGGLKANLDNILNDMMSIAGHYLTVKYLNCSEGTRIAMSRMYENNSATSFESWIQSILYSV